MKTKTKSKNGINNIVKYFHNKTYSNNLNHNDFK